MDTDFIDAHDRHFEDAEALMKSSRLANADHLYGISAECGLKGLMVAFGMLVDKTGKPTSKKDLRHVDVIWTQYETYRSGHHTGAAYLLPTTMPFADWKIEQRYAHQKHFDPPRVNPHQSGAQAVRELVRKALKDGLI